MVNINKCPVERFIPIYLIVVGIIGICKYLKCVIEKLVHSKNPDKTYANENDDKFCVLPSIYTIIDMVLILFGIGWIIAGIRVCFIWFKYFMVYCRIHFQVLYGCFELSRISTAMLYHLLIIVINRLT